MKIKEYLRLKMNLSHNLDPQLFYRCLFIFIGSFLFFLCFIYSDQTWDGMALLCNARYFYEDFIFNWRVAFKPDHIIIVPLLSAVMKALHIFGLPYLVTGALFNIFFSSLCCTLLFLLIFELVKDIRIAFYTILLFGSSFSFWLYTETIDNYMLFIFFEILLIYACVIFSKNNSIFRGILLGLTFLMCIGSHINAIFLLPGIIWFLFHFSNKEKFFYHFFISFLVTTLILDHILFFVSSVFLKKELTDFVSYADNFFMAKLIGNPLSFILLKILNSYLLLWDYAFVLYVLSTISFFYFLFLKNKSYGWYIYFILPNILFFSFYAEERGDFFLQIFPIMAILSALFLNELKEKKIIKLYFKIAIFILFAILSIQFVQSWYIINKEHKLDRMTRISDYITNTLPSGSLIITGGGYPYHLKFQSGLLIVSLKESFLGIKKDEEYRNRIVMRNLIGLINTIKSLFSENIKIYIDQDGLIFLHKKGLKDDLIQKYDLKLIIPSDKRTETLLYELCEL